METLAPRKMEDAFLRVPIQWQNTQTGWRNWVWLFFPLFTVIFCEFRNIVIFKVRAWNFSAKKYRRWSLACCNATSKYFNSLEKRSSWNVFTLVLATKKRTRALVLTVWKDSCEVDNCIFSELDRWLCMQVHKFLTLFVRLLFTRRWCASLCATQWCTFRVIIFGSNRFLWFSSPLLVLCKRNI